MAALSGRCVNIHVVVQIRGRGYLPQFLCSYKHVNGKYITTGGVNVPSLILCRNLEIGLGRET
jgi:hypothetical protein